MRITSRGKPSRSNHRLSADGPLKMHLLGLVASSQGMTEDDVVSFFEKTLFGSQYKEVTVRSRVKKALVYLEEEELIIRSNKRFRATDFGRRVAMLYIDPESAIIMRRGIKQAERGSGHSIGILHLIVQTPDMTPKFNTRGKDEVELDEVVQSKKGEFLIPVPSTSSFEYYRQYDDLLGNFRTVLALISWITENPEQSILEKYQVEPGDLHRMVDNADWLVYSFAELARLFSRVDLALEASELRERIKYGIRSELIPLTRLDGVGRIRARSLFAAGFSTVDKLSSTPVEKLASVPKIGPAVAAQIKKQLP